MTSRKYGSYRDNMNIIVTIEVEGNGEKFLIKSRPHESIIGAFCEIATAAENYRRIINDKDMDGPYLYI